MSDAVTHEVPTPPTPASEPHFEPVVTPEDGHAEATLYYDPIREAIEAFSAAIGRPVSFRVETRRSAITEEAFSGRRVPASADGRDPFYLYFNTVPLKESANAHIGFVTDGLSYRTNDADGRDAVGLDSQGYRQRTTAETVLSNIERWAASTDQAIIDAPDVSWIPLDTQAEEMRERCQRQIDQNAHAMGFRGFVFTDSAFLPLRLLRHTTEYTTELLTRWLEQVRTTLDEHPDQWPDRRRDILAYAADHEQRRAVAARKAQITEAKEWAERLGNAQLEAATREARVLNERLHAMRQEYAQLIQRTALTMAQAEAHRTMQTKPSPEAFTNLERLLEHGEVTSIAFHRDGSFHFRTPMIHILDDRSQAWHQIGEFNVSCGISTGHIAFENMTQRMDAFSEQMHHPHVFGDGYACLGNFTEMVADFVADQDWIGLIDGALLFLSSANTNDSAGKHVHRWPFVDDPESVGLPAYTESVEPFSFDEPEGHDDDDDEDEEPEIYDDEE